VLFAFSDGLRLPLSLFQSLSISARISTYSLCLSARMTGLAFLSAGLFFYLAALRPDCHSSFRPVSHGSCETDIQQLYHTRSA
jgi:hypothetical protein